MANNKGVNPVAAGMVGAAVGAAVGIAAVELADEKNRKTVQKKFGEIKQEGEKVFTELKKTVTEDQKDKS